jgi:DNA-binding PadR family transcriptional regulator
MSSSDMFESLILKGFVEVAGIDAQSGEFLYSFTDLGREELPNLQRIMDEEFNKDIMSLWELGILEMNISDSNPSVKLTERAFDNEVIAGLSQELRVSLQIIMDALRIQ